MAKKEDRIIAMLYLCGKARLTDCKKAFGISSSGYGRTRMRLLAVIAEMYGQCEGCQKKTFNNWINE